VGGIVKVVEYILMSYKVYCFAHFVIQRKLKDSLTHLSNKTANNHVFVSITDNLSYWFLYKDSNHIEIGDKILIKEKKKMLDDLIINFFR